MGKKDQVAATIMNDGVLNALYGYYVKYDRLTQLINHHFKGSNATTLNVFIDMNDILLRMSRYVQKTNIVPSSSLVLVSGLVNMAAHYRQFFRTRYGCHTKIWIINGISGGSSSITYGNHVYELANYNRVEVSELLSTVCAYIPDVMFYLCETEPVIAIMGVLSKEPQENPSIVITKDPFNFQLAGYIPKTKNGSIMVLRPSKYKGEDNSYMVTHDTAIRDYFKAIKSNIDIPDNLAVRGDMLPIYMALTRVPSRKYRSLYDVHTAVKFMIKATNSDEYFFKYSWDPDYYFEKLYTAFDIPYTQKEIYTISKRYQACDCIVLQAERFKKSLFFKEYQGMINLYDPKGIKEINEKYFKDIPLDLEVF